eukprot:CAMPEP_0204099792 /NCGR_PEP_ID=MMETSP0360-20130528/193642_1 /ASSEMBLY_ACC=CAM_ASM_000342 /TAXON_ID=268821 /ORGANISM="Scrippsiella Hangoei, Strain SHTV-5" /LENGTH=172 /DNA_ID=CAMNT_0051049177 /DNA_START=440 /DNA_END=957 /DNA_ORIENTATION=-
MSNCWTSSTRPPGVFHWRLRVPSLRVVPRAQCMVLLMAGAEKRRRKSGRPPKTAIQAGLASAAVSTDLWHPSETVLPGCMWQPLGASARGTCTGASSGPSPPPAEAAAEDLQDRICCEAGLAAAAEDLAVDVDVRDEGPCHAQEPELGFGSCHGGKATVGLEGTKVQSENIH